MPYLLYNRTPQVNREILMRNVIIKIVALPEEFAAIQAIIGYQFFRKNYSSRRSI